MTKKSIKKGTGKRGPGKRPTLKYQLHSAKSAIQSLGMGADPFLHLAQAIKDKGEGADAAAKHLSQFIEPQLSRTELTGPDSSALTINMTFDKEPKK